MPSYPEVKHISDAIEDGSIERLSIKELAAMNALLVGEKFMGPERQIDAFAETVRVNMTRVLIESLQTHISDLNHKNGATQFAVILLTIASLIGTGFQTWYGYKADRRSEPELAATASKQQIQQSVTSIPIQAQAQSSSQAKAMPAASTASASASSCK